MYDNLSIYDNIFYLGCQIYFLFECRSHLGEYATNRGFSRITRITRILRGFLVSLDILFELGFMGLEDFQDYWSYGITKHGLCNCQVGYLYYRDRFVLP